MPLRPPATSCTPQHAHGLHRNQNHRSPYTVVVASELAHVLALHRRQLDSFLGTAAAGLASREAVVSEGGASCSATNQQPPVLAERRPCCRTLLLSTLLTRKTV